jgi:hypothetical protein
VRVLGRGRVSYVEFAVSEISLIVAVMSAAAVGSLTLCLLFLLVVYLKGDEDDLLTAAKALRKIRSVGVGPSIHRAIEAWKSNDNKSRPRLQVLGLRFQSGTMTWRNPGTEVLETSRPPGTRRVGLLR